MNLGLTHPPVPDRIKFLEELLRTTTDELNVAYQERFDASRWRFIRKFLDLQIGEKISIVLNEKALADAIEPMTKPLIREGQDSPSLDLVIDGGIFAEKGNEPQAQEDH